jgi:hypothetical protein
MNMLLKKARRESGIAEFERNCRLTKENGRKRKACFVPGTQEAGHWSMLNVRTSALYNQYCDEEAATITSRLVGEMQKSKSPPFAVTPLTALFGYLLG